MRLILPGRFYYWHRAALFLAVAVLLLTGVLVACQLIPYIGRIEGPENPYLTLLRIALPIFYGFAGWLWFVRPEPGDRETAWLFLGISIGLFSCGMLGLDTAMINRTIERSSHPRRVLASTYDWEAVTGGRTSPRRTFTVTGLLFPNADNSGIERVPWPDGGPGRIATCFVDHEGWLGGHWISGVHDCDRTVEHVQ
jgi:hypothetical protein